jgi:hypothetical protein
MSICYLQSPAGISRFRFAWFLVSGIALLLMSGCGGGYSGPTGTVSGSVTLNGQPVPSGSIVSFIADDGFVATGIVDAAGAYKLEVAGQGPKVPAATYKVMVAAPASGGISDTDAEYEKMMQSTNADAMGSSAKVTEAIPSKFTSTATSGLSFPVNAGENTINIELK